MDKFRKRLSKSSPKLYATSNDSFIVNSIGRSGSQMLIKCLDQHGVNVLRKSRPHNNHFMPNQISSNKRVIFLYANPISIVLSVLSKPTGWIRQHYKNLCGKFELRYDFTVDSLCLGRMFDAFMRPQKFHLLSIKYEKLWDHQDSISEFVGRKIILPTYRPRKDNSKLITQEEYAQLLITYQDLIQKMDHFPSLIKWNNI